jgi:hypothetical protein
MQRQLESRVVEVFSSFQEKNLKKKFLFITGVPRSGTTLLANLINVQSCSLCLDEPILAWLQTGKTFFSKDIENDYGLDTYLPPNQVLKRLLNNNHEHTLIGIKETFRTSDHPIYPTESLLNMLLSHHMNKQISVIIRDPRDVWASVVKRNSFYRQNISTFNEMLNAWRGLCLLAVEHELQILQYENLVRAPHPVLGQIFQLVGIPIDTFQLSPAAMSGYGDHLARKEGAIFADSIGKYKKELNRTEIQYIEDRCALFMERFGYLSQHK